MNRHTTFIATALFFGLLLSDGRAAAQEPAPQADAVWAGAVYAGNNERYWTALAGEAWWWDTGSKVVTTIIGLLAFSFPFIFKPSAKRKWLTRSLHLFNVGAFAASLAVMLISSADYNELSLIQRRWQALRTDWDSLWSERGTLPAETLQARIDALDKQKRDIEQSEPSEKDKPLMHRAWLEEVYARGVDPDWIERQVKIRQAVLNAPN